MLEHPGEQHEAAGAAALTSVRRPPSSSSGRRRKKASDNAEASGSAVLATSRSSASDTTATGGVGAAAENATSPAIPDQPAQATVAATDADANVGESAAGAPMVLVAGTPDVATPPVVHVAQAAAGAMAPGNELHNCQAGDNETLDPPPGITIEIALVQFPPPRPTEGVHNRAPDKTSFRPQWNCFLADEPNRRRSLKPGYNYVRDVRASGFPGFVRTVGMTRRNVDESAAAALRADRAMDPAATVRPEAPVADATLSMRGIPVETLSRSWFHVTFSTLGEDMPLGFYVAVKNWMHATEAIIEGFVVKERGEDKNGFTKNARRGGRGGRGSRGGRGGARGGRRGARGGPADEELEEDGFVHGHLMLLIMAPPAFECVLDLVMKSVLGDFLDATQRLHTRTKPFGPGQTKSLQLGYLRKSRRQADWEGSAKNIDVAQLEAGTAAWENVKNVFWDGKLEIHKQASNSMVLYWQCHDGNNFMICVFAGDFHGRVPVVDATISAPVAALDSRRFGHDDPERRFLSEPAVCVHSSRASGLDEGGRVLAADVRPVGGI